MCGMTSFYSTLSVVATTSFQKVIISACLLYFLLLAQVDAQNQSEEVQILLSFRNVNSGANMDEPDAGYWSTWNKSEENPCGWIGVTCTNNQTVWQLDFSGWGFSVTLNQFDFLSGLRDLRQLDLSSNSLSHFPYHIGTLTQLTRLDISKNRLSDSIPANISSSMESLRFLSLQQNIISGEIPSLHGLVNLQSLYLGNNNLSGPFPKMLGELRHLVEVDLSQNSLSGTIPALPHLSNLIRLELDKNEFTGFETHNWTLGPNSPLKYLSASFNHLKGVIPSAITTLSNLQFLNLSRNNLSGHIPPGFSQQYDFVLDLSQNQLRGEIPPDMLRINSSTCSSVNASHNLLTGNIPLDGANYFCLNVLDLSHNNLSGQIPVNIFARQIDPDIFEETVSFSSHLWLQYNHLSGDIVELMVEGLQNGSYFFIGDLRVQNNLFTGDLSRLANTSYNGTLEVMDLTNNKLQWTTSKAMPDPITATLQKLTSSGWLTEFKAGGNNFSGAPLPTACFQSQSGLLNILDLSNNHLEGKILAAAFNSTCLPFLASLNLSKNNIVGPVPEAIILLRNLETLDLSNNNLSGPLPNISLTSSLFNPEFFAGNSELCGYPLTRACPGPSVSPATRGMQWWLLLIIIGGSMMVAVGSCLVTTWRWRLYRKRHQQDEDLIRTLMERDAATLMSLRELRKATDNFAESAQIGKGGFGIVYKGKLNDGTIVAIKRSKRDGIDKDKEQFLNEVRILSQVSHRNLVKLLGCCLENKIALLVFEFVPNGTLQEHLEGKIGSARLTWKQRLKIAVQTADALNYLHSAATFPIYHRDVKSANILLTEKLNAQVADFGISRLAPLQATHVSTLAIHGTMGYIDPEYYTSFRLTDKSDVYGFGVVLLELISAKSAIGIDVDGEKNGLVNFARPYIEKTDLRSLIDPAIVETYNDPAGNVKESIINVGRLAMKCLEMQSKARPSMSEVLNELQTLWLELSGTSQRIDTISEDESEDDNEEHVFLLSHSFSGARSISTMQSDPSGIQMSDYFSRESLRSRSMGW